ncbi:MAG: bifunctional methionine sulfoxide reductase B/A protein [Planctomycetota bacterium]|nr:bifunctional methionine sulfoxide reductase B/A protein [Planctomycetota bacterium]
MNPRTLLTIPALVVASCLGIGCHADTDTPPSSNGDVVMADASKEDRLSDSGYDLTPPTPEEKEKLVAKLTPEQFRITQKAGTEPAFCGTLLDNKKEGIYVCQVCGLPLFDSADKFTSGTGWPSFTKTFDPRHVVGKVDRSHGMVRTEILCGRCGSHLGHVFEDGPAPTGLRFCLNSESLRFIEKGEELPPESRPVESEEAFFAGGCFWGVEYAFSELPGVLSVTSGYQNGETEDPDYRSVCSGTTGHAESVRVRFDPERIDYETLVRFFFRIHDPTTMNRQGPDVGTQYRSGIYTVGSEQLDTARKVVADLSARDAFGKREIVTEIEPAQPFTVAEEYHQDYVARTGRACHPGIGEAVEEYKRKLSTTGTAG